MGVSKVNDWFVWSDAGTIRIGHGPDWTSDTARSAGTALVMVNGILLNNASITNGPAASRGTYVGTTRSAADAALYWLYGSAVALGGASLLAVWNCYNRVNVGSTTSDTTDSWTYATNTWRAANNSTTNMRAQYVVGLAEDSVSAVYCAIASHSSAGVAAAGVGVNSTTAFSGTTAYNAAATALAVSAAYSGVPGIGFNFISALENASGATSTFYGDIGTAYIQSGLHVQLRM